LNGKISELDDSHSIHDKKLMEIRRDLYNEIINKVKKIEEFLNIEYKKENKHIEEYVKKSIKK
jgi:hypothetical protein